MLLLYYNVIVLYKLEASVHGQVIINLNASANPFLAKSKLTLIIITSMRPFVWQLVMFEHKLNLFKSLSFKVYIMPSILFSLVKALSLLNKVT